MADHADGIDVVVNGIAGAGTAARLAANGHRVCLLVDDTYDATRARDTLISHRLQICEAPTHADRADYVIDAGGRHSVAANWYVWTASQRVLDPDAQSFGMSAPMFSDTAEFFVETTAARQAAEKLADALRLKPLLQNSFPGFVWRHFFYALLFACEDLLLRGAAPARIDEAMVAAGFREGPYSMEDTIGLDAGYAKRRAECAPRWLIADRMVEEGRLGRKAGVGWYRYPGDAGAVEDPLIEDLIAEEAHFAGKAQGNVSDDQITGELCTQIREMTQALRMAHLIDHNQIVFVQQQMLGWPPDIPGLTQEGT